MKKILSVLLALALVFGPFAVGASALAAFTVSGIKALALSGTAAPQAIIEGLTAQEQAALDAIREEYGVGYRQGKYVESSWVFTASSLSLFSALSEKSLKNPAKYEEFQKKLDDKWDEVAAALKASKAGYNTIFGFFFDGPYEAKCFPSYDPAVIAAALRAGTLVQQYDALLDGYIDAMNTAWELIYKEYLTQAYIDFSKVLNDYANLNHLIEDLGLELPEEIMTILEGEEFEGDELLEGKWAEAKALFEEYIALTTAFLEEEGVRLKLTFSANGGVGGPAAQTGIIVGKKVTLPIIGLPTRAGYAFKGWATAPGSTIAITSVAMYNNKTVYAIWAPSYTLTYNANGGAGGPAAQTGIEAGALVTLSTTAPAKAGFAFGGWTVAPGGTTAITSVVMNSDKTVYAIWTPIPIYTLTYNPNGGAGGPAAQTGIEAGAVVTLSATAPAKAGFTFGGWAAAEGGTTAITSISMDGDKTVYAIWTPIPTYTLTYDANGGVGGPAAQANILLGTEVTLATTGLPTREGYSFKGWAASAAGTAIITSVTVNENTTVYAVWEQNVQPPAPDPILELLSGFLPESIAGVLAVILRYVFFGWLWGQWL